MTCFGLGTGGVGTSTGVGTGNVGNGSIVGGGGDVGAIDNDSGYARTLLSAQSHLCFYRDWFLEGNNGYGDRTGVVTLTTTSTQECTLFSCIDSYARHNPFVSIDYKNLAEHFIIHNRLIPIAEFDRIFLNSLRSNPGASSTNSAIIRRASL